MDKTLEPPSSVHRDDDDDVVVVDGGESVKPNIRSVGLVSCCADCRMLFVVEGLNVTITTHSSSSKRQRTAATLPRAEDAATDASKYLIGETDKPPAKLLLLLH